VMVEYTASAYCYSFGDIILEMIRWGKDHRERLRAPLSTLASKTSG
jgi:hypothetical protein